MKWEYDWKYLVDMNVEETVYDFVGISFELRDLWF
jgi:hypothetical protein